ncbi:trehalose/maltose import ATP-binding protein MalK [Halalkalicoccus paucihalophilus]|uniref:Trehalose/maltose import ATP-binding protein MalK n=1 Tax=Halalkalicoccus paucihalophilus TaxID=1008153 RepID=A0A151A9L7_9EURY|nr:oligopeptide/dipeptide ABC transporter ATP-binding protein [Halalkalicoccus paucihalophilus]KYH24309.1 trehalose/maltose import ATP-binding protein MalK [Halalkalicoccus paucihalophilus]
MKNDVLLEVDDLKKHFKVNQGWIASLMQSVSGGEPEYVHAVDGVSFNLHAGETLGLAGESGCGKTTTGMSLVKLHEPTAGDIVYNDKELSKATDAELKEFRQNAQMIFQDPFESLNPRMTVYDIVAEPLRIHDIRNETARVQRALEFAELLPAEQYFDQYPHELSGGQRQRIAIARALVLDPDFIVADEPVSMLDVSLRAGVLSLLDRMTDEFGLSVVYISHDLSLLRHMCDRLAIMYMGKIVEKGPTDQIIENPQHPYTQALINAVPVPDPDVGRERVELQGEVGDVIDIPTGCRFKARCPEYIGDVCDKVVPPLEQKVNAEQDIACHIYESAEGYDPYEQLADERQERNVDASDTSDDTESVSADD